jgi:acyl carrier protein
MSERMPKIQSIISETLDLPSSTVIPEASLETDLGADSLSKMDIIMAIEDTYGFKIPDEDATKFGTVQDILSYLDERLGE